MRPTLYQSKIRFKKKSLNTKNPFSTLKITPYFSPQNGGLVTLFNPTSKALYNGC